MRGGRRAEGRLQVMAKDTCWQIIIAEGNGPSLMMVEWLKGKQEESKSIPGMGGKGLWKESLGMLDVAVLGACFESICKGKKKFLKIELRRYLCKL